MTLKFQFLFGFIWLPTLLFSQFQIETPLSARINDPIDVIAVDLDNDGDDDVLSIIEFNNTIVWYENRGNNVFGQHTLIEDSISQLTSIYTADMDNDGDFDILVATNVNPALSWYKNLGNGTFSNSSLITPVFYNGTDIIAVDLDNDGFKDVVATAYIEDKISWFRNLGNGTFGTENVITLSANGVNTVVAGDLDTNGTIDLVACSGNNADILWYSNTGAGVFGSQNFLTTSANYLYDVWVDDINNDTIPEIMYASNGSGTCVGWYENLGANTFGMEIILDGTIGGRSVRTADIDNDNDPDLIVGGGGYKAAYFENIGGSFSTLQYFINDTPWNVNRAICVASDMDNDGDIDIISAMSSGSGSTGAEFENIFLNVNNGNFDLSEQLNVSLSMTSSVVRAIFDVDNDLDKDILRSNGGVITWQENQGNGIFRSLEDTIFGGLGDNVVHFDIDMDGDEDIIASRYSNVDEIGWYENLGGGNYALPIVFATASANNFRCIRKADMDNDGWIDVVVGIESVFENIVWHKNMGGSGFSSASLITPNNGNLDGDDITVGDLDNDGLVDVLALGGPMKWYKNNGSGSFDLPVNIATTQWPQIGREIIDFDNDGDNDIVAVESDDIVWYINDGNANFSPSTLISNQTPYINDIDFSDVDVDGDIDIICHGISFNSIAWIENLGGGMFSAPIPIHGHEYSYGKIFCVDMDDDFVDDLIVSRWGTIFQNGVERFTNTNINYCINADTVALGLFGQDTICNTDGLIALPSGFPVGGTYQGPGVIGNQFDPDNGTIGVNTIVYSYIDTNNCEGTDASSIFVYNGDSIVVLDLFVQDTICNTAGLIALPLGFPVGGTYQGAGIVGNQFDTDNGTIGMNTVVYSYTNANNCEGTDSVFIFVQNCASINELEDGKIKIFPNPNIGTFNLSGLKANESIISIYNPFGEVIFERQAKKEEETILVNFISSGVYFVQVKNNGSVDNLKFTIID